MQRSFLHTIATYNESGIPIREYLDCDSIPIIKIYSHDSGELMETPTVVKSTIYYPTGCYYYTLDWRLYLNGKNYYDIVTFIYDGNEMETDRRYFRWGQVDPSEGDSAIGFDNNLMKALFVGIQDYTDFTELIGHTTQDERILKSKSLKNKKAGFPCMTYSIAGEVPLVDGNQSSLRTALVEFRFWHPDRQMLLCQLCDMLMDWISESNTYQGMQLRNDVFYSYNIEVDQKLASPTGEIPWFDDEIGVLTCGFRIAVKAACY